MKVKNNGRSRYTDKQMARATQVLFEMLSASVSKFMSLRASNSAVSVKGVPLTAVVRVRVDKALKQYLLSHGHDDVVEAWEKTGKWPHERDL